MKHTPGPWEVKYEFNVMDRKGRNIAACGGFMTNVDSDNVHAEKIANARLVSAAPEMYEALENVCTEICSERDRAECPNGYNSNCYVLKALRKARGEGE